MVMQAILAKISLYVLNILPLSFAHSLGRTAGRLLYLYNGRDVKSARVNLSICYPQMPEEDREHLVRTSLREYLVTMIEMFKIWGSPEIDWAARIDVNGVDEQLRSLLAQGKGVILAAPHLGNWEMAAYGVRDVAPMTALYRPPRQSYLEEVFAKGRKHSGMKPVPTNRQGLKALNAALKGGEMVAILPDQTQKKRGASAVTAPFLGYPARTMTLLPRLAHRHASPVAFIYAERIHETGCYRLQCFEGDPEIGDADVLRAATAMNAGVERCVRACPEQYQWLYRRFRPAFSGEPNPYKAKSAKSA